MSDEMHCLGCGCALDDAEVFHGHSLCDTCARDEDRRLAENEPCSYCDRFDCICEDEDEDGYDWGGSHLDHDCGEDTCVCDFSAEWQK